MSLRLFYCIYLLWLPRLVDISSSYALLQIIIYYSAHLLLPNGLYYRMHLPPAVQYLCPYQHRYRRPPLLRFSATRLRADVEPMVRVPHPSHPSGLWHGAFGGLRTHLMRLCSLDILFEKSQIITAAYTVCKKLVAA